jgi:translation initiation factor IF-3
MRIHRHRRFQKPKFAAQEYRSGAKISALEVRVIGPEGEPLGVMSTEDARRMADEKGLDLIEVSPKANPPVCRLGDYGQFKYQKEKEARKQRAQSKEVEIKGIRLTPRIGIGDLDIRVNQAKKFFEQGDKIKIEMMLRGRERAHADVAAGVFKTFSEKLGAHYPIKVEQELKLQGGKFATVIARQS